MVGKYIYFFPIRISLYRKYWKINLLSLTDSVLTIIFIIFVTSKQQKMYHNHNTIYIAVIASALLSSCVSLRQYTELSQDKHRADSVSAARIEMLEGRLRQVSSSRLALLQDTLRLNRQLDSMRGCYLRLLRGSDSENAMVVSRLKESRSRLAERGRRMDEQAESLVTVQKHLAETQGKLVEREILLAEQQRQICDKNAMLRNAEEKAEAMARTIDEYGAATEQLRLAMERDDSTGVADAVQRLSSLSECRPSNE